MHVPRCYGRRVAIAIGIYLVLAYLLLPSFWRHYEHLPAMASMPKVTQGTDGLPGDPLNVGLAPKSSMIIL